MVTGELPGQLSLWPEVVAPVLAADVEPALPDAAARTLIRTALQTNMLVEAGAGAGKTTEMVHRMLALVLAGVPIAQVAAVTFTRKAAAELRERFQTRLEAALRGARADGDLATAGLISSALRDVDRAFIGTIHSFCARLLRERPVDARLDPAFRELQGAEQRQLETSFWHTHLDRLAADGDPQLVELTRAGLRPGQLFDLFHTLVEQPDVHFETEPSRAPDADAARRALELWLDDAERLMPRTEPDDGWDALHRVVQQLRYHRHIVGWGDRLDFLGALCTLPTSARPVQKRWSSSAAAKQQVKELGERYTELMSDGIAGQVLRAWRAHRYPIALNFGLRAADAFQAYREREGLLTFQDLLMLAARLLREQAGARRELAERYRHLLVDEFQDTDPVQAEVVFLLAAGEDAPLGEGGQAEWTRATPRAGALFVVGDPKQSIYRFRRADIGIYNQVKQRIAASGSVVELTANFRSRTALAALVNATFGEQFPPHETETQAAFAPMNARRENGAGPAILSYVLDDGGERGRGAMERADPEIVATWIADRIASGERQPGDFLLLARMNKFLSAYAASLEARGVPVQVTGGGVGIDEEVAELLVVLRALEDPGDGTRTLAALVGMFFGLDYEQIAAYVLGPADTELPQRRALDITRVPAEDTGFTTDAERAVANALRVLRRWWQSLHDEPADVAVGRMVDELGLLPHAAAGALGETRAGAVLFLLDTLRLAAARGDASLSAALAALEAAYADDEGEAPLRPGRSDVVRIMTLHKAKGLEAPVVMLVAPFGEYDPPIDHYIERAADGRARGWLRVLERSNFKTVVHAAPADWEQYEAREQAFDSAEAVRLLYVAATRARDELVVALPAEGRESDSPWRLLYAQLAAHGVRAELSARPAPHRPAFGVDAREMRARVDAVAMRRRALAVPTYRAAPVKVRAGELSEYEEQVRRGVGPAGRGIDWGSAVHGALEAAAQHGLAGVRLREHCRGLLIAADRPVTRRGEPTELDELVETVAAVLASPLFARVRAAGNVQIEAPFALALDAAEYRVLAAAAGPAAAGGPPREIIEGVIDLAFREGDGWTLVDYKSDQAGARIDAARRAKYRAQVDLYAAAWQRITGEPVKERTLLFTADGSVESW